MGRKYSNPGAARNGVGHGAATASLLCVAAADFLSQPVPETCRDSVVRGVCCGKLKVD